MMRVWWCGGVLVMVILVVVQQLWRRRCDGGDNPIGDDDTFDYKINMYVYIYLNLVILT